MSADGYFLSRENPVANTDQRTMEDTALRLMGRPDVHKARRTATVLLGQVFRHTAGEQMARFDAAMDEYIFHYAMRAAASDGQYPGVLRFMTPPHHWFGRDVPGSRWGADNPDFCYRIIPVSHDGRYEIRGQATCAAPPAAHYALMGGNTAAPRVMGLLDGPDIVADGDGGFVITVDADPPGGRKNHIQTRPGAFQLWIRDALGDWLTQSPNALHVTRLNPPTRAPLTDDQRAWWMTEALLDGVYYHYFLSAGHTVKPPNQVTSPAAAMALGAMARQYTASANIVLEQDEALIVTASGSDAQFRNAVLGDIFMNSVNYWDRTGSLNHTQMAPDESGLFTYVIAHRDPGVHNWLDTGGLRQTIFGQRWQAFPGGTAKELPTIEARVVRFADLERELPAGVRRIDAEGREQQLADRRAGLSKRFIDD